VVPASSLDLELDPRRWRTLAVTLVVGFMSLLDVTIVNVAIPSIERGLDASAESVQWVVSGYALTFGLVLVAGGRLGDLVGRRRMFLAGLTGFTLTSAVAGAGRSAGSAPPSGCQRPQARSSGA
jgi:MFS family permease